MERDARGREQGVLFSMRDAGHSAEPVHEIGEIKGEFSAQQPAPIQTTMKKKITLALGRTFPAGLSLEAWAEEGNEIYRQSENLTWQLADWAAWGERHFGPRALNEYCENHGMNTGSVKTYGYVAAQVPMDNRMPQLSFSHHMAVATLPLREQRTWLARALKENWSVAELRRALRAGELSTASDGPIIKFADRSALDLEHFLTTRPSEFWTAQTRVYWRDKLRPLVDFYQENLARPIES